MNVVMHSKSIHSPSKKKVKESVPFANSSYDFSTVATNGEITYNEREIEIVLGLPANSKEGLHTLYSTTLEWLVDVGCSKLIFDDMPEYYFLAEIESNTNLEQIMEFGTMSITFTAYPFKIANDYAGEETWDHFNFEVDYAQSNEFYINGEREITVYNSGRTICPVVECNSDTWVKLDGYETTFKEGISKDWAFKLQNGANVMKVKVPQDNGTIKFKFRKETL